MKVRLLTVLFFCASVCSFAQVRVSYSGDTLQGNVRRMTEYRYEWSWSDAIGRDTMLNTKRYVYTYDAEERLETVSFYFLDNMCSCRGVVRYSADGSILEKALYGNASTICEKETHKYNSRGKEIERRSVRCIRQDCNELSDDLSGFISHWAIGNYSSIVLAKYGYDNIGRLVKTETKNFDSVAAGEWVRDTAVEVGSIEYDGSSTRIARVRNMNFTISRGGGDTVVETTDYKYDAQGNKIEEYVLKIDPRAVPNSVASKKLLKYDAAGMLLEEKEYSPWYDVAPPEVSRGMQIGRCLEYVYDSLNEMTFTISYKLHRQKDGTEVKQYAQKEEVWPKERSEYDRQGNVIKATRNGVVVFRRGIEYY